MMLWSGQDLRGSPWTINYILKRKLSSQYIALNLTNMQFGVDQ